MKLKLLTHANNILLLVFLGFASVSAYAQTCSINTNVNGIGGTGTASNDIGQSFTACGSGTLSTVKVGASNTGSPTAIVRIYAGEGSYGTLLGQGATIAIASNRTNTWNLESLNIKVVSGQKYTAMFLATGVGGYPSFQYGTYPLADYYPGGKLINYGASNNDLFFSATITQLNPTLTPTHSATGVSRTTPISLLFDRAISLKTGNILLKNLTNATTDTIGINELILSNSNKLITLPTTALLEKNTQYEIIIPSTALAATTGISYEGKSSTQWRFTTSNQSITTVNSIAGLYTKDTLIPFSISFTDDVLGFDSIDINLTNCTIANFSGSGKNYTVHVTPLQTGNVAISIPVNATTDGNTLATDSIYYDNIAPTVLIKNDTLYLDTNGVGSITVLDINNQSIDNYSSKDSLRLSLDTLQFTCDDLGENTVTLTILDEAGNAASATATVTVLHGSPVIVSKNITIQLDSTGSAIITADDINNGSASVCGSTFTLDVSQSVFTCENLGTNVINLIGTDKAGTEFISQATVIVENKNAPTAIAKNINIQLNASNGKAAITTEMINDHSFGFCDTSVTASISKTQFTCNDVGANEVLLIVQDAQGNKDTAIAIVTVISFIADDSISAASELVVSNDSTTITIHHSTIGVNYTLRNDSTLAVISETVAGTGNPLVFNTGAIPSSQSFSILAETTLYDNAKALDFDGTNDMVSTNITTTASNTLTIEAWVYPRSTNYDRLISNYSNTTAGGEFILDTYNTTDNGRALRFYLKGTSSLTQFATAANVLTLNTWNHVAATFNNGALKIYANGSLVGSATASFTTLPACSNLIRLGEDAVLGTAEYFNGKMDEVRIWTTARTQAEIAGNMHSCLQGNETGLKTYFKIAEGSGTSIVDIKAGSTGTLTNMDAATDWVEGHVRCITASCSVELSQLVTIMVDKTTSTTNTNLVEHTLTIYPNPVSNELTINSNNTIQQIEVFNLFGQLLKDTQNTQVDVSNLAAGIYYIKVTTDKGIAQSRFVKK